MRIRINFRDGSHTERQDVRMVSHYYQRIDGGFTGVILYHANSLSNPPEYIRADRIDSVWEYPYEVKA